MVGQRFGSQVVLRELGNDKVEIQCDCGTIKSTPRQYLLNGESRSCGCGRFADRAAVPVAAGDTFFMLLVIQKLGSNGHKREVLVRCLCGNHKVVFECDLRSGDIKSCGCLRRRRAANLNRTHGESGATRSVLYNTWSGMWNRIRTPRRYPTYVGITIHPEWRSFESFRDYINANLGERIAGFSLDRIDNDKGYEPSNVRWASAKQQVRNRSSNVLISVGGVSRCLAEWAELLGVDPAVIRERVKDGWPLERAVTAPLFTQRKRRRDAGLPRTKKLKPRPCPAPRARTRPQGQHPL